MRAEKIQGVYQIKNITSGRAYYGFSRDIRGAMVAASLFTAVQQA